MRIVGGRHRGRPLLAPAGRDTRPTAARTREAVFNILAHGLLGEGGGLEGALVLDAFCGTGALGLEALSRGARHAVFLDSQRAALDAVRANLASLGETERATLLRADATRPPPPTAASRTLVFLDPPYRQALIPAALAALKSAGWLAPAAAVVAELAADEPLALPPGFAERDTRRYGDTHVVFLVADWA